MCSVPFETCLGNNMCKVENFYENGVLYNFYLSVALILISYLWGRMC